MSRMAVDRGLLLARTDTHRPHVPGVEQHAARHGGLKGCSKAKMSSQHGRGARTQLNTAIFARLAAGHYIVWGADGQARSRVAIVDGGVTELDWR